MVAIQYVHSQVFASKPTGHNHRSVYTVLMDIQRPLIDQIPDAASGAGESIATGARGVVDSVTGMAESVRSTLGEFGATASAATASLTAASSDFLDLNGTFAKAAFLLLVLFVFFFLLRLGAATIGYFSQAGGNPYVVRGVLPGSASVEVSQDPTSADSVPILRSTNAGRGAEFTWSVWVNIDPPAVPPTVPLVQTTSSINEQAPPFSPIFVKGEGAFDAATGICVSNGPGMYVRTDPATGICTLRFVMDAVNGANAHVDVPNFPLKKWVRVDCRLRNTVVDIYINGVVAKQHIMVAAPAQNYYNVHVCPNGGFGGHLADLRYANSAMSAFAINSAMMFGFTTTPSSLTVDPRAGGSITLNPKWY